MSQERRCRSSSGADIRHNEGGSDELEWFKATFSISPRVMPISISSLSVKIAQMTLQPLSFAPLLKCTPPSFQRGCRLVASGLPAPIRWLRGSCSLRSFPAGVFHQPRVPGHALARLTGGLHFSYLRLILRANGSCIGGPQKEWQLALSLRGLHV